MSANKGDKTETILQFSMRAKNASRVFRKLKGHKLQKKCTVSKKFEVRLFDIRTIVKTSRNITSQKLSKQKPD